VRQAAASPPESDGRDPRVRAATWSIFAAVSFGSASLYAAWTAAPLIVIEMTESRAASGTPGASALLGTAAGSAILSAVMARRGRRSGLRLGYTLGIVGALSAVAAAAGSLFLPFLIAMLLIGVGHSANQLSRFAVSDIYPGERKASALSWIVWAGTIGAILGPSLLRAGESIAHGLDLPGLTGSLLFALLLYGCALACVTLLTPDLSTIAVDDAVGSQPIQSVSSLGARWRRPHVRLALTVMVTGQIAMLLVMTMTPLHVREHGHGLVAVGAVMTSHFIGMFALTPAIGTFVGRRGAMPAILIGLPLLALGSSAAALSPPSNGVLLGVSLLIVGLGWSFGFIAGSALLTHGMTYVERVRLQGSVDAVVWSASAVASVSSGFVLSAWGFVGLCLLAAALVLAPAAVTAVRRSTVEASLHRQTLLPR
jgi:MFS family permease